MAGCTDSCAPPVLGFLTAIERDPHGLFGGYLLLNLAGQPVEFHCTAPVKPSRIQQILYGPTLEPFLYGEQIGATLVKKSSLAPLAVLVDKPALLSVRQHISSPVALDWTGDRANSADHVVSNPDLTIGRNRLLISPRNSGDSPLIAERLAALDEHFDLSEPFGRIRAALEEALFTGAKAA